MHIEIAKYDTAIAVDKDVAVASIVAICVMSA
jgi:hypothetical protein